MSKMYVFWQSMIIVLTCASILPSKIFNVYLRDTLLAGFYQESIVIGRIRCVYSCSIDAQCYGVAYHQFRQVCYLYNDFPKCINNTVDFGMVTYLPKGSFIQNIALNKPVNSSGIYNTYVYPPCYGVDGMIQDLVHTLNSAIEWWCVDLQKIYNFQSIVIYNRNQDIPHTFERTVGFKLRFSNNGNCNLETFNGSPTCYKDSEPNALPVYNVTSCNQPATNFSSRFIFLSPRSNVYLNFRELVVWELKD